MLTWAKKTNIDFTCCPNLNAFFERMSRRDGVRRAMKEEGLALAA
jgi:uncharacterized protein YijF (DUF1287 family)